MSLKQYNFWSRAAGFAAVFCLLCALALVHDGRLFGYKPSAEAESAQVITRNAGTEIINTAIPGKDIAGYGGPVPLSIYVSGGRIDSVSAQPNSETPGFFRKLEKAGLTHAWDGLTLQEAARKEVDAVSGATYSSRAYIENVRAGVAYALDAGVHARPRSAGTGAAGLAALAVLLCGAVIPLFVHNRRYRLIQQLANVGVLGFWAGTFIDYAMMLNFFSGSLTFSVASVTAAILMIVGLLYPLAGKGQHYCAWICPFGSLQDLAGQLSKRKLPLSPTAVRTLDTVRQALWIALMTLLFAGWGASWIDYEIFTAFIVRSASWTVIGVGAAFTLLSVVIPRPFCRFVCPTGSLLKQPS